MSRRRAFGLGGLLLLAGGVAAAGALGLSPSGAHASRIEPGDLPSSRPNIVVIETDDQTVEQLRVMKKTLRLIGGAGTTFDSSFVSFSLCCPSRATLLTGQYAHNHGVLSNGPPTGGYPKLDHKRTLAVWLRRAGYSTAFVGKFLNGYQASRRQVPPGWSEWHAAASLSYFNYIMNDNGKIHGYGSRPSDYQSDVFTRKARAVIGKLAPRSRPFFLWVSYFAPHAGGPADPDDPPGFEKTTPHPAPGYANAFQAERLPRPPAFNEADLSDKPSWMRNRSRLTAEKIAGVREVYQQQLESLLSVDDGVEAIVKALREKDQLHNTVIIFTDDNGFFHGEHRLASGKALLYEPAIRVPLLMRVPGVPEGRHIDQMVWNGDIAPTILDLADAHARDRVLDGRSLLPLLRKPSTLWGRDILIERPPGALKRSSAAQDDPAFAAVRTPRFIYAEYRNGERELYDLKRDPGELRSLHDRPSEAPVVEELHRRLLKLRNCRGEACRSGPRAGLRLRFEQRVSARRACAVSDVRARIVGADEDWTVEARFFVHGRLLSVEKGTYLHTVVPRSSLSTRAPTRVRARVLFKDGRFVDRVALAPRAC